MKITQQTTRMLKHFADINNGLEFRPGNKLTTFSKGKTVYAQAVVDQEFDKKFAISDISKFVSVLSLFGPDAELDVSDKTVTIKGDGRRVTYTLADPGLLVLPPEKDPKLAAPDVQFELSAASLAELLKAKSVLGLPEVAICGLDKKMYVQALDTKNPTSDVFSVDVGKTDKKFRAIFKEENLRMLPGDYEVSITAKGLSRWKGPEVEYYIVVDQASTF